MNHHFRYLSRADVEAINVPMAEIIGAVEFALTEKAFKRTHMPAKHWMEPHPSRWFGAMSSIVPAVKSAAVKWQTGSSENAARGFPYITGLLILNDIETGLPDAVMDSTWLTAMRTAAETAVAAKALAIKGTKTIGVIGCGVQGRTNVEALLLTFPGISAVYAFDIDPVSVSNYAREMQERYDLRVVTCKTPREAVEAGDIVVTGGPIEPRAQRVIDKGWLKPGGLGVPLDYVCYWKREAFAEADILVTDDQGQIEHIKEYGYFADTPPVQGELGDVLAGLLLGRTNDKQRAISLNMGVSVEDVTTARLIVDRAGAAGLGSILSL
jgi:ornithine cyclodeaminase/alanine dehydrogenase